MKVITVTEPECGGKPTLYAAVLSDWGRETLRKHIERFRTEAFMEPVEISEEAIETALDLLKSTGYSWMQERFMVEIVDVDEPPAYEKSRLDLALAMCVDTAKAGLSAYDLCVAVELKSAMDEHKARMANRKAARDRLYDDAPRLFELARAVVSRSGGASTPREAAYGAVAAYMQCGMDVAKAEELAKRAEFTKLS